MGKNKSRNKEALVEFKEPSCGIYTYLGYHVTLAVALSKLTGDAPENVEECWSCVIRNLLTENYSPIEVIDDDQVLYEKLGRTFHILLDAGFDWIDVIDIFEKIRNGSIQLSTLEMAHLIICSGDKIGQHRVNIFKSFVREKPSVYWTQAEKCVHLALRQRDLYEIWAKKAVDRYVHFENTYDVLCFPVTNGWIKVWRTDDSSHVHVELAIVRDMSVIGLQKQYLISL